MKKAAGMIILVFAVAVGVVSKSVAETVKGAVAVSATSGDVKAKVSDGDWKNVAVNNVLPQGAVLRTGADSKVKLVLDNGNKVVVGPLSQISIISLANDYGASKNTTDLELENGSARAVVAKLSSGSSDFTIRTPTAVAGVRGTDFAVEINEDMATMVTVFDGSVEVGSIIDNVEDIKNRVMLKKDETTEVLRNMAPKVPAKIKKELLEKKKERLSRVLDPDMTEDEMAATEDRARIFAVAHVHQIPEGQREKIMEQVQAGNLTPEQVQKIAASVHHGVDKEQAGRALELASNRGIPADKIKKLAELMEEGKDPSDIAKRLDELENLRDNLPAAGNDDDIEKAKRDILANMDRQKLDQVLEQLDPNHPARRELLLIQAAMEKGISRERLEPLVNALKNGLVDEKEARMLIEAVMHGIDQKKLVTALQKLREIKADPRLRALVFKALASNVELKSLVQKLESGELTIEQIKAKIEELIKAKINATTDVDTGTDIKK